ncbi:DIL domain-containing protein [Sporodiniella umbellata]|nr:DIL domain-containing protein [Sporodiniella umbellata]
MDTRKTLASRRALGLQSSLSIDTVLSNTTKSALKSNVAMSREELTSKIADSFQEFSNMLSQLSSKSPTNSPLIPLRIQEEKNQCLPSPPFTLHLEDSEENTSDIEETPKQRLYSEVLETLSMGMNIEPSTFVCTGGLEAIREMIRLGLDVNIKDDKQLGLTPLMHAAYFGNIDCLDLLLNHPSIEIEKQDKKGWTALVWAISGCQEKSVELLLKHGAEDRLKCGREVLKYSTCAVIGEMLSKNRPFSKPPTRVIQKQEPLRSSIICFNWSSCLPDQMFAFSQEQIPFIIDRVLKTSPETINLLKHEHELSNNLWAPANIFLLCARFAHYNHSRELLNKFIHALEMKLTKYIKSISRSQSVLSFWLANICQLVNYLKKDNGLFVVTLGAQESLSCIITEIYALYVLETQKALEKTIEISLMEYNEIDNPIQNVDSWKYKFVRSSTDSNAPCPQDVNKILSDSKSTLQSYHVPPAIVIQAIAQFFYYISSELFNRILVQKKYLNRSKALQIRLNISALEEWLSAEQLPCGLFRAFDSLVQLLQLLQCLSQMNDMATFTSTIETFDHLHPLHIKKCVQNYRYETSELKLPDHIEVFATNMVSTPSKERRSLNLADDSRRSSVSSLNSLITPKGKRMSSLVNLEEDEQKQEEVAEKKNTKYLLPFSVFNTAALLQGWTEEKQKRAIGRDDDFASTVYHEIKLKKLEDYDLLDKVVPTIPYEWLTLLLV